MSVLASADYEIFIAAPRNLVSCHRNSRSGALMISRPAGSRISGMPALPGSALRLTGRNQMRCPSQVRNPGCHRHNRSPAIGGGNPDPVTIRNCARHDCRKAGRPYCRCRRHNDPHPGVRFCPSSHLFGGNRLAACPRLPRCACRTADKIPPESLGRVTGLLQQITAWRLPQRGRTCQQLESYSLLPPLDVLLQERSVPCQYSKPIRLLTETTSRVCNLTVSPLRRNSGSETKLADYGDGLLYVSQQLPLLCGVPLHPRLGAGFAGAKGRPSRR